MKDAYYFSHDSNARHDLKIQALRSVYGIKGYGMYWIIIEMMRDSSDYSLPYNQKFAYLALSRELESTVDEVKVFINDCIYEFGLFICNDNEFWSDSLKRRMELYDSKRAVNRENGKKGGRPPKIKIEESSDLIVPEKIKKQSTKKQVELSEGTIDLCNLLIEKICLNNINAKIPNDITSWLLEIDKLIRIDCYGIEDIKKVINWSQTDSFWKTNILSAGALRKQFGKLILQSKNKTLKKPIKEEFSDTYERLLKYTEVEHENETRNIANSHDDLIRTQ